LKLPAAAPLLLRVDVITCVFVFDPQVHEAACCSTPAALRECNHLLLCVDEITSMFVFDLACLEVFDGVEHWPSAVCFKVFPPCFRSATAGQL